MKKEDIFQTVLMVIALALSKLIPEHYTDDKMTFSIHDILPYLLIAIWVIYFNYRIKKRDKIYKLKIKYYKANKPQLSEDFRKLFTEDELETLGFRKSEINRLIGGSHGIFVGEVIPHYEKYFD